MKPIDISNTQHLFGPSATIYGPTVASIIPRITSVEYRFWNNDSIVSAFETGKIGMSEVNAISVMEILFSAHLAASSSIIRSARWFEATWREYEAGNLLGWAACCRSLLEAIGDTIDGLLAMGKTLAYQMPILQQGLTGFDDQWLNLKELEDKLIHFSHARKVGKAEQGTVPATHVAQQTANYIAFLESAGGPTKLYAELCQIGHPARGSLSWMYADIDGGFRIDPDRDAEAIRGIVERHVDELHMLPSLAFNPGLFILRVLVKFGLFPHVPELEDFSFQGAKGWDDIKSILAKSPETLSCNVLVEKIRRLTITPPGGVFVER